MGITEIVLLGIALSMDAFAVTISNTFVYQNNSKARALLMPVAFGLFQGLMPCIGFFLGHLVSAVISQYAGIITFAILGFIGAKMIWDALHEEREADCADEQRCDVPNSDRSDLTKSLTNSEDFSNSSSSNDSPSSDNSSNSSKQVLPLSVLGLQAIATSIDTLAVGVSFAALSVNVVLAASLIALTTALMCCIALVLGRRFGSMLGERATILGGIVLIAIGIKALLF